MNILMISNDVRALDQESDTARRMVEYGTLAETLHILVLGAEGQSVQLSEAVTVEPSQYSKPMLLFRTPPIEGSFDLVTAQDPFLAGLVGYRLAGRLDAPLQLQLHTDLLDHRFRQQSFGNSLRYLLARRLLPRADCLRAVSPRMKEELSAAYPDIPVTLLPVFVDRSIGTAGEDRSEVYENRHPLIVMVSRLSSEKNIPLALRVVRTLQVTYPDMLLLIVGDGPERKPLKQLVKYYDIEEYVQFEDWQENVKQYYLAADVYLLTSNYEGYGRTLVEAASLGTPIVSTNVGVASEIDGAEVVSVGSEEELREAIQRVIKGPPPEMKLPPWIPQSKTEYLRRYKESWKQCCTAQE